MRAVLLALLSSASLLSATDAPSGKAPNTPPRADNRQLDAIHEARIRWARERVIQPPLGIYHDYRAILDVHAVIGEQAAHRREQVLKAARDAGVEVVMWTGAQDASYDNWNGYRSGVLFMHGADDDHVPAPPPVNAQEWAKIASKQKEYADEAFSAFTAPLNRFIPAGDVPVADAARHAHHVEALSELPYDVSFRSVSTHILAQRMLPVELHASVADGHVYIAHDWLCDPTGFSLVATNAVGTYEIGDHVPMIGTTQIVARFPVAAHITLLHDGKVAAESDGAQFTYMPTEPGAYRLQASLTMDKQRLPWIYANPIYFDRADDDALPMPPADIAQNVKAIKDISYAEGSVIDTTAHQLDLYVPADKKDFPVVLFVHGSIFREEDRGKYAFFANRLAKAGIGVVIPSYRKSPPKGYTDQVDDLAAATAWTVRHIAENGGDPKRIYLAGHSTGAHLASLLALDPQYLKKYNVPFSVIHGVAGLSGIYDVRGPITMDAAEQGRAAASPITHVNRSAPPFLIAFAQWDGLGRASQAREMDAALRKAFVATSLVFVPHQNHVSELLNTWKDDDPLANAVVRFVLSE